MNIVIVDDSALLREGVAGLLDRRGHTIIGQADTAPAMIEIVSALVDASTPVDLLITDVRMSPGMADDGLKAAVALRKKYPSLAVLVLSQYVAAAYAVELFQGANGGTGYLLKDRVSEVADFLRSIEVIAAGGTVIDPDVARALMSASRSGLSILTPRESVVLELMSRGKSNREIADELVLSAAAVAKHVSNIFLKLRLDPSEENRRVKAILEYLAYH